jgi:hypothetical protein
MQTFLLQPLLVQMLLRPGRMRPAFQFCWVLLACWAD